jgi:hypothetical protein
VVLTAQSRRSWDTLPHGCWYLDQEQRLMTHPCGCCSQRHQQCCWTNLVRARWHLCARTRLYYSMAQPPARTCTAHQTLHPTHRPAAMAQNGAVVPPAASGTVLPPGQPCCRVQRPRSSAGGSVAQAGGRGAGRGRVPGWCDSRAGACWQAHDLHAPCACASVHHTWMLFNAFQVAHDEFLVPFSIMFSHCRSHGCDGKDGVLLSATLL